MIKSILFQIFKKVSQLLSGKGIENKLPLAKVVFLFLHRRLSPNYAIVQGSRMYIDPYDTLVSPVIVVDTCERTTTELFKAVVKEGSVVLDLGSHIGYYALLAARIVGKAGKVYAFEPDPHNFSFLIKNIEANGYENIIPLQKAVSDKTGAVKFFRSKKDTGSHTIYDFKDGRECIQVESIILDEFFRDNNTPIDVVKMDIEGAEAAAFSGMDQLITANRDLKVFAEFWPAGIRRSGYSPEEFLKRVVGYGFYLYLITGKGRKHGPLDDYRIMELCKGERHVNIFLQKQREE